MKGWRSISINGYDLRWLFLPATGIIRLRGLRNSGQTVEIEISGWKDPWINFAERKVDSAYPVTPKLIREAALFALENGWDPASRIKPTKLVFNGR